MRLSRKSKYTIIIAGFCLAFLFMLNTAQAGARPDVSYSNGLLSVKAIKTPLLPVLESIGEAAGIEILVSRDIKPGDISIQITDEPLEEALKRVLRGLSHAAVYSKDAKDGGSWRISALKIYPKGKYKGELMPVFAGKGSLGNARKKDGETKTVVVSSGQEVITYGGLEKGGLLIPSQTVPNPSDQAAIQVNAAWFMLQKQLERKEARQYEELMLLKRKLGAAENPERKDALALAYADEVEKFYSIKKANLNKIEALKRICHAREIR